MQRYLLCIECAKLQYDVVSILEKLVEIESMQLAAFRADDISKFERLDMELEAAIDEKERRIGALKQHRNEYHQRTVSGR
jgi:hypothetical protein